jgi:hypothetical protein
MMADVLPHGLGSLVNGDFRSTGVISMNEQDIPKSFSFNTINGETVEATIICWQLDKATAFAMTKQKYFCEQQHDEFFGAWTKIFQNDSRWVQALAGLFSEQPVDGDCIATILGHYVLGNPTESPDVLLIRGIIKNSMASLRGLTYLGTAASFLDEDTFQQIAKDMGL